MNMEDVIFAENSQFLTIIYLISATICLGIVIFFLKLHRSFPSSYVFGLFVGFAFLALSDFFFVLIVNLAVADESFNVLHWSRLMIGMSGFVIIGSVYVFQKLNEKKFSRLTKFAIAFVSPTVLFILYVFVENIQIPSFSHYNEYFRLANILAIGYATLSILLNKTSNNGINFSALALGFIGLLASQFTQLFFAIEPNALTLYASGLIKIGSFALILFTLTREPKTSKSMKRYEK